MINIFSYSGVGPLVAFATHSAPRVAGYNFGQLGYDVTIVVIDMDEMSVRNSVTFQCRVEKYRTAYLFKLADQIYESPTIRMPKQNVIRFNKPTEDFSNAVVQPRHQA